MEELMGLDMYLESRGREVAYWRKANQVHAWFVENVQGGRDDCGDYPVSRERLEELRDTCQAVLDASPTRPGRVVVSETYRDGGWVKNYEPGEVVADTSAAERLLPTRSGFFFGGTGYDQYYLDDLRETVRQIEAALGTPETEFTYHSSW